MSIYLDTSALAKLVVVEAESDALRTWLASQTGTFLATNTIGVVELHRLTSRISQEANGAAVTLLARIDVLELIPASLGLAAQLPPPEVGTLDALHIASAALLPDQRMAQAARAYGLPVNSPGA